MTCCTSVYSVINLIWNKPNVFFIPNICEWISIVWSNDKCSTLILSIFHAGIRLSRKKLQGTNALAYFCHVARDEERSFMTLRLRLMIFWHQTQTRDHGISLSVSLSVCLSLSLSLFFLLLQFFIVFPFLCLCVFLSVCLSLSFSFVKCLSQINCLFPLSVSMSLFFFSLSLTLSSFLLFISLSIVHPLSSTLSLFGSDSVTLFLPGNTNWEGSVQLTSLH
jgi:hypothetical protein